ncbi:MAG: DUF4403 family protein [Ferribacterium limneticum]
MVINIGVGEMTLCKLIYGWLVRAVFIACIGITLTGCGRKELFEAPPRVSPQADAPSSSTISTLTLVTGLSYDSIRKLIETQTPSQQNFAGNGHVACGQIPFIKPGGIESREKCLDNVPYCDFRGCGTQRVCEKLPDTVRVPSIGTAEQCADYNWTAVASRQGEAVVGKSGDDLHLELPIQVTGKAGLGGDLAKLLSLSGKSFEAQLRPGIDVSMTLGSDWCPKLNIKPTNRWVTSANVEVVGRNCLGFDFGALGHPEVCAGPVNINLTGQANDAVVAQQSNLTATANSAINCKSIQDTVAAQWRPIAIPLAPDVASGKPLYLNISPKGFAFSGLKATDDSVKVALKVWAETKIDPIPVKTDPIPLPQVSPFDAKQSRLSVSLAARVPYSDIVTALGNGVRGKDFSSESSAGKVRVHIEDIDIYPTTKGLAIGVKIDAELPGQILNTKGWIYLVGTPKATMSGSSIEITNLGYSTVVDNKAWQILLGIFDGQILKALSSNANIDLKSAISKSAEQLATKINGAKVEGLKVIASIPTANLNEIHIGVDSLTATVSANMDFSIHPDLNAVTKLK